MAIQDVGESLLDPKYRNPIKKISMVIYGNVWYLYDTLWCLMVFLWCSMIFLWCSMVLCGTPVVILWYLIMIACWSPMVHGIIGSPQDTGTIQCPYSVPKAGLVPQQWAPQRNTTRLPLQNKQSQNTARLPQVTIRNHHRNTIKTSPQKFLW